jgi:hypothetical protein
LIKTCRFVHKHEIDIRRIAARAPSSKAEVVTMQGHGKVAFTQLEVA